MLRSLLARLAACMLLAGLGAGLALYWEVAGATPPPPSFWDFTLANQTGAEAAWVEVDVWHADAPEYETLPSDPTVEATLDSLAPIRQLSLATPGTYGASRLAVSAFHMGKYASVEVSAPQGDYDGDGRLEWAGFCPSDPDGATHFLGVQVLPPLAPGGPYRLRLTGMARWGDFAQVVTQTALLQ